MNRKRRTISTSQRHNRILARPLDGGLVALSNHRELSVPRGTDNPSALLTTSPDGVGLLASWPTTPYTFATEIIYAESA